MFKSVLKIVVALVLVGSIVGCASGSGKINWDDARKVKQGMTQQEVTSLMGQPYKMVALGKGEVKWIWVHVHPLTFASASAHLTFKDGKVENVWEIPDSF